MNETTIYDALESWKNKEQNLVRLFSERSLMHPSFLKAKLDYYKDLNNRYSRQKDMKGDVGLKVLRGEINVLERTLYPNLMERLIRRALTNMKYMFGPERLLEHERKMITDAKEGTAINQVLKEGTEKSQQKTKETNSVQSELKAEKTKESNRTTVQEAPVIPIKDRNFVQLNSQLRELGFGDALRRELREKISRGSQEFSLTMQKNRGEDVLKAVLHFGKSAVTGQYELTKYSVALKNNLHLVAIQQTFFTGSRTATVTFDEAHNLLSGRAVYKEANNEKGEKYHTWLQLDFRESTKQGEYKLRQFHDNYGYDLQSVLRQYPIKNMDEPEKMQELIRSLQQGNRSGVTMEIGGKEVNAFVEASPRFKSVNLYDQGMNRVHKHELKEMAQDQKQIITHSRKQGTDSEDEPAIKQTAKKKRGRSIT